MDNPLENPRFMQHLVDTGVFAEAIKTARLVSSIYLNEFWYGTREKTMKIAVKAKPTEGPWELDPETNEITGVNGQVRVARVDTSDDFPCLDFDGDDIQDINLECLANGLILAQSRTMFDFINRFIEGVEKGTMSPRSILDMYGVALTIAEAATTVEVAQEDEEE